MDKPVSSTPFNRVALIVGACFLALIAFDGIASLGNADFGIGVSDRVDADSTLAIFLLGLVLGLVAGIGIFFTYIVLREKKFANDPSEVDALLDEIAAEKQEALFLEDSSSNHEDEKAETLDPWERPSDWWKSSDED